MPIYFRLSGPVYSFIHLRYCISETTRPLFSLLCCISASRNNLTGQFYEKTLRDCWHPACIISLLNPPYHIQRGDILRNHVAIVAACRTPIGTIGGQFKTLTALDLSVPVMQALVKRSGVDPALIDDVIWGCNYQRTYLENNLARVAAIKAGLPETVPGITVHRNCTSSMSSIQLGFYQIMAG